MTSDPHHSLRFTITYSQLSFYCINKNVRVHNARALSLNSRAESATCIWLQTHAPGIQKAHGYAKSACKGCEISTARTAESVAP